MKLETCLLVLAVVSAINAQSIPQFEPLFSSNRVEVTVVERPQTGDEVLSTRARGLADETIIYGLDLPTNDQGALVVDSLTGLLTVGPNGPGRLVIRDNTPVIIQAEVYAFYNSSGSALANRAYLFVMVEVRDVNDAPDFGSATIDIPVSEITAVGATFTRITAVDHDLSNNGVVTYALEQITPSSTSGNTFVISQFTGDLIVAQSLELNTPYQLRITATDEGIPPLSSILIADIVVTPVPPTFLRSVYNANISEFTGQVPVTVTTVEARDSSPHTPGTVLIYAVGTVIPASNDVTFSIGRMSGILTVNGTVDRETHSRYLVQVKAYESGHDTALLGAGFATVVLTINDVNEPPEFLNSYYTAVISEGASVGTTLFSGLVAVDNDEGVNAALRYSITMVTGLQTLDGTRVIVTNPFFLIDSVTGVITVNTSLEREATVDGFHYYEIIVTVSDAGVTPLTATTLLAVTVADVNDNAPVFNVTTLSFSVPENEPMGSIVGEFIVIDSDQGSAAEMSFSLQGNFNERFYVSTVSVMYSTSIEAQPPVVTRARVFTAEPLDREDVAMYQFSLIAQDVSQSPLSTSIPLTVSIVERNDNAPVFTSPNFTFTVPEDANNTLVSEFMVSDTDIGSNGEVDFSLESTVQGLFSLVVTEPFATQLHFSHSIDREVRDVYSFRIFATDRGTPTLIGQTEILINITDVNDNSPVFERPLYEVTVIENEDPGVLLTTVIATDRDIGDNKNIEFSAANQSLVEVDSVSGNVSLAAPPDFEMGQTVDIEITATDNGEPSLTGVTTLRLTITDVNDNRPVFTQESFNVSVFEEVAAGSQFGRIVATDADSGIFGEVVYSIINASIENTFRIDNATGFLTVERVLDRETMVTMYTLTVSARDNGNPPLSSEVAVAIEVMDINDQTPIFINEPYVTNVDEGFNESVGVFVYMVSANDADVGTNSQIDYSLAGEFVEFFTVGRSTGVITVSAIGVDYEAVASDPVVVLTVIATDKGTPPRLATTTINITVLDGNDNAPEFIGVPYIVSIAETRTTERLLVLTINATDLDAGDSGEIQFRLAGGDSGLFEIDDTSGELFLPAGIYLDRETDTVPHHENGDAVYRFGVAANDRGSPQQVSFATVSILVTDINDNIPVFPTDNLNISISESLPVDTAVLNLVATDNDFGSNAQLVYSIVLEESSAGVLTDGFTFSVNPDTGVLSLAQTLDRETVSFISLVVVATDQGLGKNQDNVTVFVNVTDANDNRPIFAVPPGGYSASVLENSDLGTDVITVMATDLDQGTHQSISYAVLSNVTGTTDVPFEIVDPTVGVITVSGSLDRESVAEYQVLVVAMDLAGNVGNIQQSFATVRISILDVNDNAPAFASDSYRGTVAENSLPGTTVELNPTLSATDADTSGFFFNLLGNGTEHFTINSTTGVILTTGSPLDFEDQQEFTELVLQVHDGNLSSSVPLLVSVTDVNDNNPVFDPSFVVLPISETVSPGTEVVATMATDRDQGRNSELFYYFDDDDISGVFTIDSLTGVITVNNQLDFESQASYLLTVVAQDMGEVPLNGTLVIDVSVTDENDNPPVILNGNAMFRVLENSDVGTVVGQINATDQDTGVNGELDYLIVVGNSFQINSTTGEISTSSFIDRELQSSHELIVQVMDTSLSPLSIGTSVTIIIDDVNDNTPVFQNLPTSISIPEDTSLLSEVFVVVAMDADIGNNSDVVYAIVSQEPAEHFVIDENTGSITSNTSLDYESVTTYTLIISAQDKGMPSLSINATLTIILIDENDNTPMFENNTYSATIAENAANDSIITSVQATDADSGTNGQIVYSIISILESVPGSDSPFQVDSSSGVLTVFNRALLDFEMIQTFHVQLLAMDLASSARSSQALLSISLTDVNDNAPGFSPDIPTVAMVTEGVSTGTIVTVARAMDDDQGLNAAVGYSIIGGDIGGVFSIDGDGTILVNGPVDFESQQSYDLELEAIDGGSPPLTGTFVLTVMVVDINDNAPVFPSNFPDTMSISEATPSNTELTKLSVSDADSGENGRVTWRIVNQEANMPFRLSSDSASLSVVSALDRETTPQYSLVIEATDNGVSAMSAEATIIISLIDVDDNLPQFESSPVFTIRENQIPGIPFGIVDTTDQDSEKLAFYFIISGSSFLSVEPRNGDIFLRTPVDFDSGNTILTSLLAAVSTNQNPGSSCTATTCSIVTLTVNVEDWNDNPPELPEFNFGVNQSSPENTVIGQISATDIDTGAFGTVQYEFPVDQSQFSIDGEDGTIRLVQVFNATADDKYNVVPVTAFDNPDNRQLSFSTPSTVRIYFVNEFELVIASVTQTLSEVQANLDLLKSSLANDVGEGLSVYIFDIQEYTTTINLATEPPTAQPQKRQTFQLTRTNITLFAINHTSRGVLTSDEFLSELGTVVAGIIPFNTIEAHPEPPTDPPGLSMETILLILYIVVGSLGGLVLFFFFALCCTCCVISIRNKRRQKYVPGTKKQYGKRPQSNISNVSGISGDKDAYQNPLWINPYDNWSDDVEKGTGKVPYRERSPDEALISRKSEEITDSVLYESQDFVMANFTGQTSESEDEEALVEIKPDAQSLSQQSTGDSTFERNRSDRVPLVKKKPSDKGGAWEDDGMRASNAELELDAQEEEETESEEDEEYTDDDEEEESSGEGEEEEEETDDNEEETTGESEEEYDYGDDPNFPENGFPELEDTNEFPLMF